MSEPLFELLYTIDSILRIIFMVIISIAGIKYIIKEK